MAGMAAPVDMPSRRRHARGRVPRWARVALVASVAVLFAVTGEAYLASSVGVTSAVVVARQLGGTGGTSTQAISVSPMSVTATVAHGRAQLDAGMETARIDIASGATGTLLANVGWLDPQDFAKVLHNPHAYILAGLYQEDATTTSGLASGGSCASGEYQIDDSANGELCVEQMSGGGALGILTASGADVVLQAPVTSSLTAAYVLTAIYVKDNAPPGQQGQLANLQFFVSAQLV